jgi:hypothetical protein
MKIINSFIALFLIMTFFSMAVGISIAFGRMAYTLVIGR